MWTATEKLKKIKDKQKIQSSQRKYPSDTIYIYLAICKCEGFRLGYSISSYRSVEVYGENPRRMVFSSIFTFSTKFRISSLRGALRGRNFTQKLT